MQDTLGSFTVTRVIDTRSLTVQANSPLKPVSQITDRAKRYRAQNSVPGPERCVLCGARPQGNRPLDVMHLSGDESDGDPKNLAYGCRKCNGKLAAAWKRLGSTVRTRQYNPRPEIGGRPLGRDYQRQIKLVEKIDAINEQLARTKSLTKTAALLERRAALSAKSLEWDRGTSANPGVVVPTFQQYGWAVAHHSRGAHDEGGAIIHATPRSKRIEYAKRIAGLKSERLGEVPF